MVRDILKRYIFRPYRKGMGPVFRLETWDTWRRDAMGKYVIGYCLKMDGEVLFEGEDFACSPLHACDSKETAAALMGFLTLRPGDTDAEYFEEYNQAQMDYAEQHAEALGIEVMNRFGCD